MKFDPQDVNSKLLENLFVDRIRRQLVDAAIAAIRPDIERAATAALEEIAPAVQKHFDIAADRMIFQLALGTGPYRTVRPEDQ